MLGMVVACVSYPPLTDCIASAVRFRAQALSRFER